MKKNVKYTLITAVSLTFLITLVSAIFSYLALANDFDHVLWYFNTDSVYGTLSMYLPLTVPVIALVCGFIIRKEFSISTPSVSGIPIIFTSVLTGLLMIASGILTYINGTELSKAAIGIVVNGVIGGICFILIPFLKNRSSSATLLSIFPALWAAMSLLEEYFHKGPPINSPVRTANLAMFAFLLLFFTEEIRFGIGCQLTGIYYFCILSATAFTGVAVLPKLAIIISGKNDLFNFDFITWCLGAALFLFLLARLASLPSSFTDYVKPLKNQRRESPVGKAYSPKHSYKPDDNNDNNNSVK